MDSFQPYTMSQNFDVEHNCAAFKDIQSYDSKFLHYHNFNEIYILLDGSRNYIIENKLINVSKHDCVILRQGVLHKTFGGNGFDRFLIYFKDDYCRHYVTSDILEYINKIFSVNIIHIPSDKFYRLQQLLKQLSNIDSSKNFIIFLDIIYILVSSIDNSLPQNNEGNLVVSVSEFLEQNFASVSSLDEIAQRFFVSKEHLCRIFKRQFDVSIVTYLNTVKIKRACALLTSSDMNIIDISAECGFNNSTYFCRVFRKNTGCTPLEFRKRTLYYEKT